MEEKKVCIVVTDENGQERELELSKLMSVKKYIRSGEVYLVYNTCLEDDVEVIYVKEQFGEIFLKIAEAYGVVVLANKRDTLWVQVLGRTSGVTHTVFFYLDDVDAVTFENGHVEVGVRYYKFAQHAVLKVNKDMLSFSADFARALGCGSESEVQNDQREGN